MSAPPLPPGFVAKAFAQPPIPPPQPQPIFPPAPQLPPRPITSTPKRAKPLLHEFHCPCCGNRLKDSYLGILECLVCNEQFLAIVTKDGKFHELSWERRIVEDDIPF